MTEPTNIKTIKVSLCPPQKKSEKNDEIQTTQTTKEKQKRIITTTEKWDFDIEDLSFENQWGLITQIHKKSIINAKYCEIVLQQINRKLYGYKSQDIDKDKFTPEKFIDVTNVIQKMIDCENACFYCKNKVQVLYEYVREPKQWSLERLDNSQGHNTDNVVIACLECNLRRKTMHYERYVFTKQLLIKKQT